MPRKSRLFIHNTFYVITSKCLDSLQFFKDERDYKKILDLLKKGLEETGFSCFSFLLLPTQFMLIIRTNHHPLNKLMGKLNTSYALYYNHKYKRKGHFFDDRYASSVIDDESLLEDCICQMNLLPLEAGVCSTFDHLDNYNFSSHAQFLGKKNDDFQLPDEALNQFSRNGKCNMSGLDTYRKRLMQQVATPFCNRLFCRRKDCEGNDTNTFKLRMEVVGSKEFKTKIYALDQENRLQLRNHQKMHLNIDNAVDAVKETLNIKSPDFFPRGRNNVSSTARKMLAYVCIWQLQYRIIDVARFFKISCAAVIRLARNGKSIAESYGIKLAIT
jgi:hypothetical protein